MKKILAVFGLAIFAVSNLTFAQGSGPEVDFSVINVSNGNRNAQSVGARPGDVLRYNLKVRSQTQDVVNFVPQIDIHQALQTTEPVDVGIGEIKEGGLLAYPVLNQPAPMERDYSFFTRVKPDCGNMGQLTVSAHGKVTVTKLTCGLTTTGPSTVVILCLALLVIMVLLFSFHVYKNE